MMFTCMPKINFTIHFFLEILHFLKDPVIWLANNILTHNSRTTIYQIWDWWWNINSNISFHFRLFPEKTKDKIFLKNQKTLIWNHFGLFLPKFGQKSISLEKRTLSVFKYSNYLPSCKKSEKTNDPFLRKTLNWRTDTPDRQISDFIGPSVGRESKTQNTSVDWLYKMTIKFLFTVHQFYVSCKMLPKFSCVHVLFY